MKNIFAFIALLLTISIYSPAADFDARAAFGFAPGRSLDAAKKKAQAEGKRIFLVAHDPRGDYNNQGLQIKYFTDLDETKKLIKENFIVVVVPVGNKDLAEISGGTNMERPRFFLLSPTGAKVRDDSMAKNSADGLRIIKELIALP
ncbi:hypothetical protein SAMN02745166_04998 [Prosthecobacter debontii]|uniref:Uncharacterized protein n=1 Tax=Prosthecobacter debontii TaxID=48467 RepID=A0A1T4Z3U5_9BACT|nr:hypothetical protein [Prosthecobacter debontii]SKB08700.1 hypothetical protein SAMN02745166_04998 [Prosthecobacter debontii]